MTESPPDGAIDVDHNRGCSRLITASLCIVGVGLQFAAPFLRDRLPLSDDLLITSILAPWWVFAQVAILAGTLALFRRTSSRWSGPIRATFALAAAAVVAVAQPGVISYVLGNAVPLSRDPVGTALLWSTPLAFYVLPASLVVFSWLHHDPRFSMMRTLGLGLAFIGIASFPFVLWSSHLWDVYIRPQGGESVLAPARLDTYCHLLAVAPT